MFEHTIIARDFNRAATIYDKYAALQAQVRSKTITLAEPYYNGQSIYDIGCGTGAGYPNHWNVIGIDIAAGMLDEAKSKLALAINASADQLPFVGNSVNFLFSSLMMQWAPDAGLLLSEWARVIRAGGIAVASTMTQGSLRELQASFASLDNDPHVSEFLAPEDLRAFAKNAGFDVMHMHTDVIHEYHPDVKAIMRSLKHIGATNKNISRRRGLMTPGQLMRLQSHYEEHFATKHGLSVEWHITYMVMRKQ